MRKVCTLAITVWLTATLTSCGGGERNAADNQVGDSGGAAGYPLISSERLLRFTADSAKGQQVSVRADTTFVVPSGGARVEPIEVESLEGEESIVLVPIGGRTLIVYAVPNSLAAGCLGQLQVGADPRDIRVGRMLWGRLMPVPEEGYEDGVAMAIVEIRGIFTKVLPFVLRAVPGGDCSQSGRR